MQALKCYEEALLIDGSDMEARIQIGRIWYDLHLYDRGASAARLVLRQEPRCAKAHVLLGKCCEGLGQIKEAMTEYEAALAYGDDALVSEAAEALTSLYVDTENWQEALFSAGLALSFKPRDAELLECLGVIYIHLNDTDRAIAYLDQALVVDPRRGQARAHLGWIYLDKRNYKEAAKQLNLAVTLGPDEEDWHSNLGLAHVLLKKESEAAKHWLIALRCNRYCASALGNLHKLLYLQDIKNTPYYRDGYSLSLDYFLRASKERYEVLLFFAVTVAIIDPARCVSALKDCGLDDVLDGVELGSCGSIFTMKHVVTDQGGQPTERLTEFLTLVRDKLLDIYRDGDENVITYLAAFGFTREKIRELKIDVEWDKVMCVEAKRDAA
jgi:tetratricopeptide (TPR) repeat protein